MLQMQTHVILLALYYLFLAKAVAIAVPPLSDPFKEHFQTSSRTLISARAIGKVLARGGWTAQVDSFESGEAGGAGDKVLDGDKNSKWVTEWVQRDAPLPHTITIDMKRSYDVNGIAYLPRQDSDLNGNIGQHEIFVSNDGIKYGSRVASGTWADDKSQKTSNFETVSARYVRLVALTEAGNRGPWTTAAEINVFAASGPATSPKGLGKWGPTIDFPLVPVAAAVEPLTGKVVTWSAYSASNYVGGNGGQTVTATFDPSNGKVTQQTVTNTQHDMFCPGLSIDAKGRFIVTGGNNAPKTSIYDPSTKAWSSGSNMRTARGYQGMATMADGRIFTIGGSWSGARGGKDGEIFDPASNTWTALPKCRVAPMLTADKQGIYRADNHAWLFSWKGGHVFQAGPSKAMNWYRYTGGGDHGPAGLRGGDSDAMCGNAVMYDASKGKILTLGGTPSYDGSPATGNAHVITLGDGGSQPQVSKVNSMASPRAFANSVVLPNGEVLVLGGQTVAKVFTDDNAILTPELWNPSTQQFKKMLPNSIPRTYHSVALLLRDGTVFSAGGGLCGGCQTNHFDAQIYTPPYLLAADGSAATRPVISSVSATTVKAGSIVTVKTNGPVTAFSMVRYGSATHSLNTDQRRIPLEPTTAGTNSYTVTVPKDTGVTLIGYWMLFALNSNGVPSVATTLLITPP